MTRTLIASHGGARISRRLVTHNHYRQDFESLLADARTHFETLTRPPEDLLRHIGSPFAPNKRDVQVLLNNQPINWLVLG